MGFATSRRPFNFQAWIDANMPDLPGLAHERAALS